MLTIDLRGQAVRVNQSKIRKNPDPWHDVVIPGLEGRDDSPTVPVETVVAEEPEAPRPSPATPRADSHRRSPSPPDVYDHRSLPLQEEDDWDEMFGPD